MSTMIDDFATKGWFKFHLTAPVLVENIRAALLDLLREDVPELTRIEDYHLHVAEDERHFALQKRLSDWYWNSALGPGLLEADAQVFRDVMGADLCIQARPYLRIARPGKIQDNVSVHRDTHYGGSPYEVSVHVPFTETGPEGSLGVISGSHLEAESAYPYVETRSPNVERNSVMHQMGFLYAPKKMRAEDIARLEPTDTHLGEALVFSLASVHGQVVNKSTVTRFSTDIRVVNAFAPIDWARLADKGYYKEFSASPITLAARRYEAAQRQD